VDESNSSTAFANTDFSTFTKNQSPEHPADYNSNWSMKLHVDFNSMYLCECKHSQDASINCCCFTV